MVGKIELSEIKKHSKELDKYNDLLDLTDIDNIFRENNTESSDMSIIAQNLMEVKLEMNLIRKNLSNDIELMINKSINETNKKLNSSFLNTYKVLETKMTNMFEIQMSQMKYEIEKMKNNISNFSEDLNRKNQDFMTNINVLEDKIETKNEIKEVKENGEIVDLDKIDRVSKLEQIRNRIKKLEALKI